MDTQLIEKLKLRLDDVVHNMDGVEYWLARELQSILGYKHWESFYDTINRAIVSCQVSGIEAEDHFRHKPKLTKIGVDNGREIVDYALTRYACYL